VARETAERRGDAPGAGTGWRRPAAARRRARGGGALAGAAVALLLSHAAPVAAGVIRVERVRLLPGNEVAVELTFSAPAIVAGQALGALAGLPDRILVDVENSEFGTSARGVVPGRGVLLRVVPERRDGGGVRFVFELLEPASFTIDNDERRAIVRLADPVATAPGPPRVPPVRQPGLE